MTFPSNNEACRGRNGLLCGIKSKKRAMDDVQSVLNSVSHFAVLLTSIVYCAQYGRDIVAIYLPSILCKYQISLERRGTPTYQ